MSFLGKQNKDEAIRGQFWGPRKESKNPYYEWDWKSAIASEYRVSLAAVEVS